MIPPRPRYTSVQFLVVVQRVLHVFLSFGRTAARVALLAALSIPASLEAAAKPNVILLMCDDLGWGDVGFNGSTISKTPHLDAMAANALKFQRFYAAAPVCSPTRGSAMTGRHPYRYGILSANSGHMKKEEMTLAEALKTQDYATGHFGKWHLGTLTTRVKDSNRGAPGKTDHYSTPAMNGFDVYFSTEAKVPTWDPMLVPKQFGAEQSRRYGWIPVEDKARAKRYGTRYWDGEEHEVAENLEGDDSRIIMDRALPFIEKAAKSSKPFFAVIWFHTPHLPVVTGRKYRELYRDRSLQEQLYYGAITAMDEQIGRLRSALRRWGVSENTMLWFASDNGPENRTPGSPGPYRGRKRSLYEGGVRVPGLLEWPARIRAPRSTDVPVVTSDYFPTVLDYLGFKMPAQPEPIDGISLKPLIEGAMKERPRPIGFQTRGMATLSDNRYKLVMQKKGRGRRDAGGPSAGNGTELYDLLADPSEKNDVAARHPEIVKKMKRQLVEWQESCARSSGGEDYRRE